jgi:uncharacterized membrane protein YhhN
MNFKKIPAPYYLIVLFIHCSLLAFEWTAVSKFTKALLMPLLMVYLYKALSTPFTAETTGPKMDYEGNILSTRPISKPAIILAFIASWAGDIFLIFEGQGYFIAGMISFMIAHIGYIFLFNQIQAPSAKKSLLPILGAAFWLYLGIKLLTILSDHLGSLATPVLVYMFVIIAMTFFAFNTAVFKDTKYWGVHFFSWGALFFVVSDMMLAYNIFLMKNSLLGVGVMLTYGIAQYTLAKGFSSYLLRK